MSIFGVIWLKTEHVIRSASGAGVPTTPQRGTIRPSPQLEVALAVRKLMSKVLRLVVKNNIINNAKNLERSTYM